MWRAFLATREPRYLQSMLRHATWMQYKQWDEFDLESANSMRTFGGSDESFQVGNDNLNGAPPLAVFAPVLRPRGSLRAYARSCSPPRCHGVAWRRLRGELLGRDGRPGDRAARVLPRPGGGGGQLVRGSEGAVCGLGRVSSGKSLSSLFCVS